MRPDLGSLLYREGWIPWVCLDEMPYWDELPGMGVSDGRWRAGRFGSK